MTSALPIVQIKSDFIQALNTHSLITLAAPPGAGKSTHLPLWLLALEQFAEQKIIMLQPRRLATLNVARFLAKQLGEPVGQQVGYRMRNDSKVSAKTRLEVVTEGVLTRMIQTDPELSDVGLIIFDEFHERSLHADLAFALSRDIQQGLREDLKLLLMSATLDNAYIESALPDAINLVSEGRSFPIEISYHPATNQRVWRQHAETAIAHFCQHHQGSILVFLPGVGDIKYLAQALAERLPSHFQICPLYGGLDIKAQQQAIMHAPEGSAKLVLSTNVAETSLTIEGINAVIDCGFEKVASFNSNTLINQLEQKAISKASATQRAGRAGRLMAGKCLRLYSKEDFERRSDQATSEIKQADLLPMLLEVAAWGVTEPNQLPFIEQPDRKQVALAWQTLISLELCDAKHKLTALGEQVSKLSTHPRFAHAILKAKTIDNATLVNACLIAAMLEERDIYQQERAAIDTDLTNRLTDINFYIAKKRRDNGLYNRICEQAQKLCQQAGGKWQSTSGSGLTGVILGFAFPERIALKRQVAKTANANYLCANGQGVSINPDDPLSKAEYVVFAEVGLGFGGAGFNSASTASSQPSQKRLFARLASSLTKSELHQHFAHLISEHEISEFDSQNGQIRCEQQTKLGQLVLTRKASTKLPDKEQIAAMWSSYVQKQGLETIKLTDKSKQLLTRCIFLNKHSPSLGLPDLSEQALLEALSTQENWLSPYVGEVTSLKALQTINWHEVLLAQLDYQQQIALKQHAPTHFKAPTENRFTIEYREQGLPTVSLPMQQCYGLTETPRIANGAVALNLSLLSPAKRPLQITHDLAGFWAGSYKEVQKEMKGRYPKHFWPDDPANAAPTTKTKKYM